MTPQNGPEHRPEDRIVSGLTVIFGCQLLGELIVAATDLPLPGPVLGMLLLFVGLVVRGEVPAAVATLSDALLRNLSLLFVPAGVGVMLHVALIEREWIGVSVALVGSSAFTVVVTAALMAGLGRLVRKSEGEGEEQ